MKNYSFINFISSFLIIFITIFFIIIISLNSRHNYSFIFGKNEGLEVKLSSAQYESTISNDGLKLNMNYIPRVYTNYFTINSKLNNITKFKDKSNVKVHIEAEIPTDLQDLNLKLQNDKEWNTVFYRSFEKLGRPYYIYNNFYFWTDTNIDVQNLQDIVINRSINNMQNYNIFTYKLPLTNKLNVLPKDNIQDIYTYPLFIRGGHTGYLYIQDNFLNLEVSKYDLNWYEGEDPVKIRIYDLENNFKGELYLEDDGISSEVNFVNPKFSINSFTINNLQAGVYKFEVLSTDSIVTYFKGNFPYLVFDKNFYLASDKLYTQNISDKFYLNLLKQVKNNIFISGQNVSIKSNHLSKNLKLSFNNSNTILNNDVPYKDFNFEDNSVKKFSFDRPDISITTNNGYICLNQDSFFQPFSNNIRSFNSYTNIQNNYLIIGKYVNTKLNDNILQFDYEFNNVDLSNEIILEFNSTNLQQINGYIKINKINFTIN